MRSAPLETPDILDFRATIVVFVSSFILSVLSFQGRDLDALMLASEAWPQEPWRLLTSCLLHVGWLHMVFNLYWLFKFGSVVEPTFGLPKTILIYVLVAALSSGGQWAVSGGGIGLSGINYGLFALLWVLHRYQPGYRAVMPERLTTFFVAWFFICIAVTELDIMQVANVAHGVGALTGLLIGLALVQTKLGLWKARSLLVTLSLLIALGSTLGRPYINFSDSRIYELNSEALDALVANDEQRAIVLLKQVLAIDEENAVAWHNLGVALVRLGDPEQASSALMRAQQLEAAAQKAQQTDSNSLRSPFGF